MVKGSTAPSTPQRVTRSMSHQPTSQPTAPGPPIPTRDSSITTSTFVSDNPFNVDFVIPYNISLNGTKAAARLEVQREIRDGYELLLRVLEGEGGLKVATRAGRGGKGKEEVWVFVGASDEKVEQLVERERLLDQAHSLPPHPTPIPPLPATRLRLLYSLLTSPTIQHGLGITPGEGQWKRVKSIAALHDKESDQAWMTRWSVGGDWGVGILSDIGDGEGSHLGSHQPPPVQLYFAFLSTYTLSLVPLSAISLAYWFLSAPESYPPFYSIILCLYATILVSVWRIRERKLSVRWGHTGCESVAVSRLRPEYVTGMGLDQQVGVTGIDKGVEAIRAGDDLKRDVKVALSVPVILACGAGLGLVLSGIFILEAFVGQVWEGFGQEVVPILPTALFTLVVPQLVGLYGKLAKALVKWEDHPTPVGAEKSLTGKTFAMNAIVAYLGLFLSAYVYVPFGPFIMSHLQQRLSKYQSGTVKIAGTAEKAGLGPRTTGEKQKQIKAGRLRGQLFAYTVTNQVVNTGIEVGLPYVMRFISDWRAGKTTVKNAVETRGHYNEPRSPACTEEEAEKQFMDKVEHELSLPEYNLFTDYAEMVTQFGYVTIWSIVWPLAPVFALINNYIEIRSDALKICRHVRRPIGERVETIGSWLEAMQIITWLAAITNATLIYLFRPSTTLVAQTPNPNIPATGLPHLQNIISSYTNVSPTLQTILPTLLPLTAVALAASHGWIILRWLVDGVTERLLWRGSLEEMELQKLRARTGNEISEQLRALDRRMEKSRGGVEVSGFWNGGEEGAREIGRVGKAE